MWKNEKLQAQIKTVEAVKKFVVVSGGLSWHLISPPHEEKKTIHDHSDVDLFVFPEHAGTVIGTFKSLGFNKYWTKYDGIDKNFSRYGATIQEGEKRVKVLIDLFVEEVPYYVYNNFNIIDTEYIMTLYGYKHMSAECTAVKSAKRLLARGESVVGRKELIDETFGI